MKQLCGPLMAGLHPGLMGTDCANSFVNMALGFPALAVCSTLWNVANAVSSMLEGRGKGLSCQLCQGSSCDICCSPFKKKSVTSRQKKCSVTTDIRVEAREGETRITTFLIENNSPRDSSITLRGRPWIDAWGRQHANPEVTFDPPNITTLKPGETAAVEARIAIQSPLEGGMAYFTEFVLEGCPAKPISVGLWVEPKTQYQHYVVCDPCRPRRGRFVEFCQFPSASCRCKRGNCSGCASSGHCASDIHELCAWPGHWDPCCHWHNAWQCQWFHLSPRESVRKSQSTKTDPQGDIL